MASLSTEYTYLWDDIAPADIVFLANRISAEGRIGDGGLSVPNAPEVKAILEELLVPHHLAGDGIVVPEYLVLLACLGLTLQLEKRPAWQDAPLENPMDLVMHLSGFVIRSRAGTRIGGRMGRPGKSKPREMRPPPHSLFPIGDEGGSRRSFQAACAPKLRSNVDGGIIEVEVGGTRPLRTFTTKFRLWRASRLPMPQVRAGDREGSVSPVQCADGLPPEGHHQREERVCGGTREPRGQGLGSHAPERRKRSDIPGAAGGADREGDPPRATKSLCLQGRHRPLRYDRSSPDPFPAR